MPDTQPRPFISVVMGSVSDWTVMKRAVEMLRHFDLRVETRVISAHRMPDQVFAYAQSAQERGLAAIIAGAGGAAHLPGMLAAKTPAPVLGVPIPGPHLQGIDALHSIVQMPKASLWRLLQLAKRAPRMPRFLQLRCSAALFLRSRASSMHSGNNRLKKPAQ